ncbi:MAG: hypothetical protein OEU48_05595 [Gammaproteobacteria bacterium]|jgi:hypothetical protein|nr:hypothetical protein [Gammaproteobacteria bacterium]
MRTYNYLCIEHRSSDSEAIKNQAGAGKSYLHRRTQQSYSASWLQLFSEVQNVLPLAAATGLATFFNPAMNHFFRTILAHNNVRPFRCSYKINHPGYLPKHSMTILPKMIRPEWLMFLSMGWI